MTYKMNEILSWARQTSELFGVSVEQAFETVAAWEHQKTDDHVRRSLGSIVALASGFEGEMTTFERRSEIMEIIKRHPNHKFSASELSMEVFSHYHDLSRDDKTRLVRAIGDDLVYWSSVKMLRQEGRDFWFEGEAGNQPNGHAEDIHKESAHLGAE